jgi:hypothetical protein
MACMDSNLSLQPNEATATVMLGEWRYARPAVAQDPPVLNVGFFVAITIDSASALHFWGRVTFWFAGDVAVPVDRFGPVSGAVDQDDGVTLLIGARSSDTPAVIVNGLIDGDVIVVRECRAGRDAGPFAIGGRFERSH